MHMQVPSLSLLLLAAICMGASAQVNSTNPFPEFSYLHHPTYNLLRVRDFPVPVIMQKYYFRDSPCCDRFDSEGGMFAPGAASYKFQHSSDYFCAAADVLYIPRPGRSSRNDAHFATIKLTRPASVFVLLTLDDALPVGTTPSDIVITNIRVAVPADWTVVGAVEHEDKADVVIGNRTRWTQTGKFTIPFLKRYAVVVEVPLSADNELHLPHPRNFRVDGEKVFNFLIVMAPSSVFPLRPHGTPALPGNFYSYLTTLERVRPALDPPIPNQKCPSWLHDIYIVQRGGNWATWHPPIDPIYWCYFDHEHGGYPGLYRPRFHYTAYHTPDPTTYRQIESHEGFKVIPLVVDDGRVVVMTLHAHMSRARRFLARHHTFVFSCHKANDDGTWTMQMEIHMKADFGPLKAIETKPEIWLEDQQAIADEIEATGQNASREVYVFNEDTFPDNGGFWMNGDENDTVTLKTALKGRYELWQMPMNCVFNPQGSRNNGFRFEFHEQQTAMKDPYSASSDNLQQLSGDGMRRSVVFVGVRGSEGVYQESHVDDSYCSFLSGTIDDRQYNGVFYTDAYFKQIVGRFGKFAMKQYMMKPFEKVVVGGHRAITNSDPWVGINKYSGSMVPFFSNTEMATMIMEN